MIFNHQHLSQENLKELIKKYRIEQIEDKLNNFNKLPYVQQTNIYRNLLIKNKLSIADQSSSEHTHKLFLPIHEYPKTNFTGLILGIDGKTLRQIEQHTKSRIYIKGVQKDQSSEPVHCYIVSQDTESLKKARNIINGIIEEAIFNKVISKPLPAKELDDWSKFYMWWFYHNNNNDFN